MSFKCRLHRDKSFTIAHRLARFQTLVDFFCAIITDRLHELGSPELPLKSENSKGRSVINFARGLFLLVVFAAITPSALAQSQFPSHDTEIWNDDLVRIGLPKGELLLDLGPQTDFGAYYQFRAGAGYSIRPLRKENSGTTFQISVTPRYDYYHKAKTPILTETENRFLGEITPSLSTHDWTIKDRNRGEARFIDGNLNWRYRNRIEVRHPAHLFALDALARYEFFYAPSVSGWREGRLMAGAARHISENMSTEIYYLRQWGASSAPFTINGLGVDLNVCIHSQSCE